MYILYTYTRRYIYIYNIYIIYIYIYINKKNTPNLLKLQLFLFFLESLSKYNKITNENTDNSAT